MSGFLAYINRADTATQTTNVTPNTGYPLSNLKTRASSETTRLPVAGVPYIQFTTTARPRFIGLFGLNSTVIATDMITVQSFNSVFWASVPVSIRADTSGVNVPLDVKVLIPTGDPHTAWRVYPNWSRVGGANYYEIGRLWAAYGSGMLELPEGIEARWAAGVTTESGFDSAAGGQGYEDKRAILRTLRGRISAKDSSTMFGFAENAASASVTSSLQEMKMIAGTTGEVVFCPRSDNPLWMHRLGFRGRIPRGIQISPQGGAYYETEFEGVEER